jgi:hypothetical protein
MLQHASKSQPRARLGGQEKKGKKVGSFSAFLSSWGSPWSVSRQAPKEAFLVFRPFEGETGVGFGLSLGLGLGVWTSTSTPEMQQNGNSGEAKSHHGSTDSQRVVMKSDPDFPDCPLPSSFICALLLSQHTAAIPVFDLPVPQLKVVAGLRYAGSDIEYHLRLSTQQPQCSSSSSGCNPFLPLLQSIKPAGSARLPSHPPFSLLCCSVASFSIHPSISYPPAKPSTGTLLLVGVFNRVIAVSSRHRNRQASKP